MNLEEIKTLVALMVDHDLSRIEIHEGDSMVLLRRGQPVVAAPTPIAVAQPMAPLPAAALPSAPASSATLGAVQPADAAAAAENETLIRSPMVGTFYASGDPEAPPFVTVGKTVSADSVVCLIEAMKVFNEIKAEVSGRISRVLVKNAQAVEFDQPLFAVTPA